MHEEINARLDCLEARVGVMAEHFNFAAILHRMEHNIARLERKVDCIMPTLDEILVKVTAQTTSLGSVKALLVGLKQQLADLLAGLTLTPAQQVKADAINASLTGNDQIIADALDANVPPTP